MTNLDKTVSRKTRESYRVLYATPRQIIVSLKAGDVLEFREAGRRQRYSLSIDGAFKHAVRLWSISESIKKKNARKARKEGRL